MTGQVEGRLVRVPRGSGGFGYDPIFLPDGFDQTTAEMTAEEKDAISHRGRAFRALTPFITPGRGGSVGLMTDKRLAPATRPPTSPCSTPTAKRSRCPRSAASG